MSTAERPPSPKGQPLKLRKQDLASLLERQLPHAREAEAALLGKLVLDPHQVNEVVQLIDGPDDFYQSKHAVIYKALVDLYDRDGEVALDGLVQRLRDLGELDGIGGVEYLIELAESVPHASGIAYHAKMVKEKAILRQLIDAAEDIWYQAYTSAEPAPSLLDAAEKKIFDIAENETKADASDLKQLLHELYDQLAEDDGRHVTGVETGFKDLDQMTSGLQKGELIIVAARPSMGKTAFALNIAEHIAVALKEPVGFFSLEMSRQALAQRLLCSRSGVDAQRVRRNMLSDSDWGRLTVAVGELSESALYIDDTPGLTLLQLRAKARRMAARHHIKAIFIDYLQLMSSPASAAQGRQQEVSELSRGVKALARELEVPVICLSQLNRGPESREGHRPRMSDLRESGSIEQDADVVMMLHREDYYHRGDKEYEETGTSEIIMAKQRNGPTGVVELGFDGSTTRFLDRAHVRGGEF